MSGYYKDEHRYDDIINLPHYQSTNHAHMSLEDRAAQFASFAALTGHEEAIEETARLTEKKIVLDEVAKEAISMKLFEISRNLDKKWNVSIRFSNYDGEFRMPLVLAQGSPILHSSCEGKLGIALE